TALAGLIAEVFLDETGERSFVDLADCAERYLGVDKTVLGDLLDEIRQIIPDAENIFDAEILSAHSAEKILEEAREALMLRNLHALQAVDGLSRSTESLEQRTRRLEESNKRDPLTNLYNRAYLDRFLVEAFGEASASGTALS